MVTLKFHDSDVVMVNVDVQDKFSSSAMSYTMDVER